MNKKIQSIVNINEKREENIMKLIKMKLFFELETSILNILNILKYFKMYWTIFIFLLEKELSYQTINFSITLVSPLSISTK